MMDGTWLSIQIFNYVLINKFLGKGALAIVYRGYLQEDKTFQMAIKTIKIATILQNQRMVAQIRREIIILQKLDHPNIVKIFDVARTNNYLSQLLYGYKKEYRFSELEAVFLIKNIVEGFKILYKLKIIHRNIKPANILLHKGVAKIAGFTYANIMDIELNDLAYLSRSESPLYMDGSINS